MVIVQFRGRLVRQYRACVIDSLGAGNYMCLTSQYSVYEVPRYQVIHVRVHVNESETGEKGEFIERSNTADIKQPAGTEEC